MASLPTNLDGLKRWIEAREAYEASTPNPTPLTEAERKAISVLQAPAQPLFTKDADFDTVDWVSRLQRESSILRFYSYKTITSH
jgi:hypothetical protein